MVGDDRTDVHLAVARHRRDRGAPIVTDAVAQVMSLEEMGELHLWPSGWRPSQFEPEADAVEASNGDNQRVERSAPRGRSS